MAEPLQPGTRISRSAGIVAEPLGGEMAVLDPETDTYLRLNATGRVIWEALAEPATLDELARRLRERTGIDAERAATDAASFVGELIDAGAAEVAEA